MQKDAPRPYDYRQHENGKPLLIGVAEFQRLLGIKKTLAFAYLKERRVRSVLAGRKRLILLKDVERLVAEAIETGSL